MNELNKPAFPVPGMTNLPNDSFICPEIGMSIRQHAAITLRVPMSGDPELDAMIREARRLDMATGIAHAMFSHPEQDLFSDTAITAAALYRADALLAASEPKKAEPALWCEEHGAQRCEECDPKKADPELCKKCGGQTGSEHDICHGPDTVGRQWVDCDRCKGEGVEPQPDAEGCSDHPDAPHGFNRSASLSAGRYVCDCEGWQPDAEGWIEWKGGDCPVRRDAIVDVKIRDVHPVIRRKADCFDWSHEEHPQDIIAYRVVK